MTTSHLHILLVDDDEDDYILTAASLAEIAGQQVRLEWAATYDAALGLMERMEHDVYLLDYRLGEQTGVDLLRAARSRGCTSPVILLTGQGDRSVDVEAMQAGATDYLIKGQITAPLLERAIRYAMERDRTLRALRESNARLYEELNHERERLTRRETEVRAQIGRDLHDGPVQQVAVSSISVQNARRAAQRAPEMLDQALIELEAQLKRTMHDLRTVLYELRPLGIEEEGLHGVLVRYIERLATPNGLKVTLDAPSDLRRLAPECEAAIFIIVQEALNNVRKHAPTAQVAITLRSTDAEFEAAVRDNGRGFDLAAVEASYIRRGSWGLLNMRERAQLIGGTGTITSAPGHGTSVVVRVPFR